ncbi:hypothetical protein VRK_30460 [Vibrio sp. MEBiC08052]|nr:hypothetical protein VRK_30460 [Vibrio sp. MEBiC08052]
MQFYFDYILQVKPFDTQRISFKDPLNDSSHYYVPAIIYLDGNVMVSSTIHFIKIFGKK